MNQFTPEFDALWHLTGHRCSCQFPAWIHSLRWHGVEPPGWAFKIAVLMGNLHLCHEDTAYALSLGWPECSGAVHSRFYHFGPDRCHLNLHEGNALDLLNAPTWHPDIDGDDDDDDDGDVEVLRWDG